MTVTPDNLKADQQTRDMLWAFEFAPADNQSHGPVWIDTTQLEPFEVVAQRASGCVFALVGHQRHVLLLTSEGQSGIVAESLQECVELVVAYPHWADVAQSSMGDLAEMQRIFRDDPDDLEQEFFDDDSEVEVFRRHLSEKLKLRRPKDPGLLLHRALTVLNRDVTQCDLEGRPLEPLFSWLSAK